jgi:hypothetical protein
VASEVTNEWTMQKVGTGLAHKLKVSKWPPVVSSIKEGTFLRRKQHKTGKNDYFSEKSLKCTAPKLRG